MPDAETDGDLVSERQAYQERTSEARGNAAADDNARPKTSRSNSDPLRGAGRPAAGS